MKLTLHLAGLLVLLLSVVCFVGCIAGIMGVWRVHEALSEKTRKITARVEVGLEKGSKTNKELSDALEKARAELAKVNKEAADAKGDEKKRRLRTALQRVVWQEFGPKLNHFGGRLAATSDAAVVVTSLLRSLHELPLGQTTQLDPDRLEQLASRSARLSVSLKKLQGFAGGEDDGGALSEVEAALQTCQTTLDDWQTDVDAARADVLELEAGLLSRMTLLAIGATVLCVWVALSQISLFAHAWKWCAGNVPRM